ncbi:MAG TPA: glycosyltransferase family 87 protein, partial [Dehalococcoidia bacterium]|nr:glycosyltransferase family 87 protein [Dehalococcoidia bacterium]
MAARLTASLIAAALALGMAPAANAAGSHSKPPRVPANELMLVQQGSSMAEVLSLASVPLGFHASAGQALRAAEHTPTMQALHRRVHPLQYFTYVWRAQHPYWYVIFQYRGRIVASANVSPDGKVTGVWTGVQAMATFAHGGWSWSVTSWMVLLPASLLFLLPFFDPRRMWRMAHLDALAILAFLASWLTLANADLEPAVWMAYPPLIYLLIRLALIGFGRSGGTGRLAPLLSLRTLVIGLPLLLGARIALSIVAHQEIDVGYESVIGAFRLLHHLPLYYNDPNHGDTYGPLTYVAYVPFELVFPWVNSLSHLRAADAAAICFDLGTIVGLVLLGRRVRPGAEGMRVGLLLAWAWAACPFSIIGLVVHTNDGLVAMLTVFALVALRSPIFSGAWIGLATAAKFSPAGLLPLIAAPRQRGAKGALMCAATFAAVVVSAVFTWLPRGGLSYFLQRTIGFQIHRFDVFSPWALHASLRPIQTVLEVVAVLFALAVAFFPRQRT